LAKHGITIEAINATAMLYKLDQLRQIDQMRDNRETARRILQKDLKRLSERANAPARRRRSSPNKTVMPCAMATEKQIAANRANAQKSTGPKTAAGRPKSGRNAFRHGLSLPMEIDGDVSTKIEALVEALASNNPDTDRQLAIAEIAQAQLELLQIRKVRAQMLAGTKLEEGDLKVLQRLLALDRYERYAHTKRRRASVKLADVSAAE
jgi:hypothetical protein